jgi:diguanylate cyclase (GGDEF)-like protein
LTGAPPAPFAFDGLHLMRTPEAETRGAHDLGATVAMPLRLLLRFSDVAYELRFVKHYVAFYFRYAQVSLLLGIVLIGGDYLVDHIARADGPANLLRLTTAVPVLLAGLGYSVLPKARRHWQPVMASFIVAVALCLIGILVRIDDEGGSGLKSWVGVLNFTFLQFYCFVILGVQFRHAMASGVAIMAAFLYALWVHAGLSTAQAAYWSYHVVTVFILAAGIGWWREFVLRKEFVARSALDDSREAAEQRALRFAHYDETTGLPNRRLFTELAATALERSRRSGAGCAVLHVEIDRLSGVHNVYGRGQGDMMMAAIAQRLRSCIRSGDLAAVNPMIQEPGVLARLGDNAFSILVADLDNQERATVVANRLLAIVAQPIAVDAKPMVLSASIGIAMFPGDAKDMLGLTRIAEQAARAAVEAGGAQHKFFDEALNARAKDRVVLEAELRHAIPAGQLRLHYQPKVDARSGCLVGAEALVRWQHPERGLIPPGHFIPLAEQSGLIVPLTDWVLHAACKSLRRWLDHGLPELPLSINLPASSLADASLPDQLEGLMRHHGLQACSLMLELTETMVMRDVATAISTMDKLRSLGFGLSLDDFGTGYSSLSYLKRLPMSELKIDRAFIIDVARGGRDGALAAAVITLGSELGLQVVAEGVETKEQSEFLISRGCALQQGYLFSKPVPQALFEQMLKSGSTQTTEAVASA